MSKKFITLYLLKFLFMKPKKLLKQIFNIFKNKFMKKKLLKQMKTFTKGLLPFIILRVIVEEVNIYL